MALDEVKKKLTEAGYRINREERLNNNTGIQLHLDGGAIVNVFDKGTITCQGKNC
jgi:predicted nucleotide-binding protein